MKSIFIKIIFIYTLGVITLPLLSSAQTNYCLQFDGVNDWVDIPETTELDIATELTVSVYVATEGNYTAKVVEKETWNSGWTIGQDKWNGWKVGIFFDSSGTTVGRSISWGNGVPVPFRWYYITMTFDGSSLKLYVDGVLKNSVTTIGTIKLNNEPVSVGADKGGQKFFTGYIDEVAVWDKALTLAQITSLQGDYIDTDNIPSGLNASDLVMYHSFDEDPGETDVFDATSNDIDGTLKNMDATADRVISRAFTGNNQNLPIELTEFTVNKLDNSIEVIWETMSENNNDYFTIERSIDAVNFKSIGNINGAGNSNSPLKYNFIDDNIEESSYYYRLKQTDYDGTFTYSNIVYIQIEKSAEIIVYPNPTYNSIVIEATNNQLESLRILDISGKDITSTIFIKNYYQRATADLSSLASGFYIIQLFSNNNIVTQKIHKL